MNKVQDPMVAVFYNRSPRARLDGLQAGHFLQRVAESHIGFANLHQSPVSDRDAIVLVNVFKFYNDSPPVGDRSLSVGDVVSIDGRSYKCDPKGWIRLLAPVTQGYYQRVVDLAPVLTIQPHSPVVKKRDGYGRPIHSRVQHTAPDFEADDDPDSVA